MDNTIRPINVPVTTLSASRPEAPAAGPQDCVSLGNDPCVAPKFQSWAGIPQYDVTSLKAEDVDTAAERNAVADTMLQRLSAFPSLSAVVAVAPDGTGNTSVIVVDREDAAKQSQLQGKFQVMQRLCSSNGVKAAAVAHPVAYLAAQAFDDAGIATSIRLPGEQDAPSVAGMLREGGELNRYDQLEAMVDDLPKGRRVAIMVGGPSAAGKSSLIKQIREMAGDRKVVEYTGDMYFRDTDDSSLPRTGAGTPYWDDPQAMHFDELTDDIAKLMATGHVEMPVYDFGAVRPGGWKIPVTGSGMRVEGKTTPVDMGADDILVIDSLHATNKDLISKLDSLELPHSSVYLDSQEGNVRLLRRMVRDFDSRGRSPQQTLSDWDNTTFPGEVKFVRPTIMQLDPAQDVFITNKFPKDQALSREEIDHKVAEQGKLGLTPTYEAFGTPDAGLPTFAQSEKTRFEAVLANPASSDAERAKAQKGLELLQAAKG